MQALGQVEGWPCAHVAVGGDSAGPKPRTERSTSGFGWASVTKLATAVSVLVAVEEGAVDARGAGRPTRLDARHLLAHASGLPFDGGDADREAGRAADLLQCRVRGRRRARRARPLEMPFAEYFEGVWGFPLGGSAGSGDRGCPSARLIVLARELQRRRALTETRHLPRCYVCSSRAWTACCPGFGRITPNDWGLGFEFRDGKRPHWTGTRNSARLGHFGGSGGFLWVDPERARPRLPHRPRDSAIGRRKRGRDSPTASSRASKSTLPPSPSWGMFLSAR